MTLSHEEAAELLGVFALDACDEEAAEVEAHLADCPRCRAELAAHREVTAVLGNLGGAAPDGLWERISAEISGAGEQLPAPARLGAGPPVGGGPLVAGAPATPGSPFVASPSAGPVPLGQGRRRRRPAAWVVALGAAAAALAIVVGVLAAHVSSLDNRVNALSHGASGGQAGLAADAHRALTAPGHVVVHLSGAGVPWRATLVVLPSGLAYLEPAKLPSLPAHRTFQVWALTRGRPVSLGVIGRTAPPVVGLRLEPGMTLVMVNAEPAGGSPQPTSPVLLQGSLPHFA